MEILLANRPMIMAVPETTLTLLLFNFEAMPAASRLTVLFSVDNISYVDACFFSADAVFVAVQRVIVQFGAI